MFHVAILAVASIAALGARSPTATAPPNVLYGEIGPVDNRAARDDGGGAPGDRGGTSETLLSIPPAPGEPFHRELADQLLSGEPMSVTPEGSKRNIDVMQAATTSAANGGRPVQLPTS